MQNEKSKRRIHRFDLAENPFSILSLSTSASPNEIGNAFDDALADSSTSENVLISARQTLLNPRQRLDAELGYLLDTPPGEATRIRNLLRSHDSHQALYSAALRLSPVSRANLLAHVVAQNYNDENAFYGLVEAQSAIDPELVQAAVNESRKAAGVTSPAFDILKQAIGELITRHCDAAIDGFDDPFKAAIPLLACTKRILAEASDQQIQALTVVLRTYERSVQHELRKYEDSLKEKAQELKRSPNSASTLDSLNSELSTWRKIAQPLILLEAYKSRDDENGRRVYDELRSCAIDLANDSNEFQASLKLCKILLSVVEEMPRASEQLREEISILEDRVSDSLVTPLIDLIETIKKDTTSLARSVSESGFSDRSTGTSKALWNKFVEAEHLTKGTAASSAPLIIVRGLVLHLHNEDNETEAAIALNGGLLYSATALSDKDVLDKLRNDNAELLRQRLQKELLAHVNANDEARALAAISELRGHTHDSDDLAYLRKLEDQITSRRNGRRIKWGLYAAVAIILIIAANADKKPSSSTSSYPTSPSNQSPAPTPNPAPATFDFSETAPRIGSDLQFTLGNIRYCKFQERRLETIKSLINSDATSSFNRLVDDYNSRCANYRYRQRDMDVVNRELIDRSSQLRTEAMAITREMQVRNQSPVRPAPEPKLPPAVDQSPPPAPAPTQRAPTVTIDTSNKNDLKRVQQRLADLGYFSSQITGSIGPVTRKSLQNFKAANNLPNDDVLDEQTIDRLFAASAMAASLQPGPDAVLAAFATAISGTWSTDVKACTGGSGSDALLLEMNARRAKVENDFCDFQDPKGSELSWTVKARCSVGGAIRNTNIALVRSGSTLTWSSGATTTIYHKCGRG